MGRRGLGWPLKKNESSRTLMSRMTLSTSETAQKDILSNHLRNSQITTIFMKLNTMDASWPQCFQYSHPSWTLYMVLKIEQTKTGTARQVLCTGWPGASAPGPLSHGDQSWWVKEKLRGQSPRPWVQQHIHTKDRSALSWGFRFL